MQEYLGGCHCGRVRFRVRTSLRRAVECNCSMCSKKAALLVRVAADAFELLSGGDDLDTYRFGTRRAAHHFCRHCGIHTFLNPRAAPQAYSINLRCLDDFPACLGDTEIAAFDGQNWEQAVARFPFSE